MRTAAVTVIFVTALLSGRGAESFSISKVGLFVSRDGERGTDHRTGITTIFGLPIILVPVQCKTTSGYSNFTSGHNGTSSHGTVNANSGGTASALVNEPFGGGGGGSSVIGGGISVPEKLIPNHGVGLTSNVDGQSGEYTGHVAGHFGSSEGNVVSSSSSAGGSSVIGGGISVPEKLIPNHGVGLTSNVDGQYGEYTGHVAGHFGSSEGNVVSSSSSTGFLSSNSFSVAGDVPISSSSFGSVSISGTQVKNCSFTAGATSSGDSSTSGSSSGVFQSSGIHASSFAFGSGLHSLGDCGTSAVVGASRN